MRKLLCFAFVFLSAFAFGQTATVTGHTITGQNTTSSSGISILFELTNDGGQQCKVSGTGLVMPMTATFTQAQLAAGVSLLRNDQITCGTTLGATRWRYTIKANGVGTRQCAVNITTATLNLDSTACLNATSTPVTVTPTDSVYCRLDGSNCGFTGAITSTSNVTVGGTLGVTGAATSQIDNSVYQANKSTGISGVGSVGVPYTGASGQGGIGESIAAMGTANGSPGILHIPAGYYNVTTPINSTANINTPYANSSPPAPLTIEGDGQASTFIIGNTGGKVFDETGRRIILKNLTILQGTSNPSTIGVYMARGTGLVSQFCDGEIIENVSIDLPSIPAANGGQDTIGIYNNACEDYSFYTNIVSAHQPIVVTSNNVYGITSSYQTIAVNLHNFDSQGRIIGGSVTTYGNGVASGQDIMLQGHASNTTIMNVSGECDGASPSKVFLYIKAPSAPDAATDPLPGLHVSGMQYECPTGGTAILNEQVLTNAFIQGNVANVAATPIISLSTANAMLKDSTVSIQVGNAGLTEPMVSDSGAATSGLQGGQIFLPATTTIALTNAASTCFGTNITATYSSPSITCGGFANQDLNGIISTFNSWKLLNAGGITMGSDTSQTFNIQGAAAFTLNPSYAILTKPIALTETTAPAALASNDVIYGDSTAHNVRWSLNGGATFQNAPVTIVLHSAYTNATTGFTSISDGTRTMSWPILANADYKLSCDFTWQGSATTTGPKFQITGPAAPTLVGINLDSAITATTSIYASATAFSSAVANTGTITTTTNFPAQLTANISNGANAGTLVVQAAANGAGTLTIGSGSCQLQ